jgi:hypothetical protein
MKYKFVEKFLTTREKKPIDTVSASYKIAWFCHTSSNVNTNWRRQTISTFSEGSLGHNYGWQKCRDQQVGQHCVETRHENRMKC